MACFRLAGKVLINRGRRGSHKKGDCVKIDPGGGGGLFKKSTTCEINRGVEIESWGKNFSVARAEKF